MILPDWLWLLFRSRIVSPFRTSRVNPSSYDTALADTICLQRYRGVEYPDTPAYLFVLRNYTSKRRYAVIMSWRDPKTREHKQVDLCEEPFLPGDSVLARTVEQFNVPRFVRLQGMLKSSVARAGVDSRTALYVDPNFKGSITLELYFQRTGFLVPNKPIVQFEAQLCLSLRPYKGHYQHQVGVTPNRNKKGIGFVALPTGPNRWGGND